MRDHERLLTDLRSTAGAMTSRVIEAEYGRRALRTALGRSVVTRLLPGVFVATEHAFALTTRSRAALMWAPEPTALTGAAALAVRVVPAHMPPVIDVLVPASMSRPHPEWLRPFRPSVQIDTVPWHEHAAATPAFAAVHAFHRSAPGQGAAHVFAALATGATVDDIAGAVARTPRIRRRRELDALIQSAARGSESYLEFIAATRVFSGPSFAGLIQQHVIRTRHAAYRIDLYDPRSRTAIELDGFAFHGEGPDRTRDARRDADLAAHGVLTVRFGYRDITEYPGACRQVLKDTLASRVAPIAA